MKQTLIILLTVLSCLAFAAEDLPPASAILAASRAQLPPYPVTMNGTLKQKAPNGRVTKTLTVEMTLNWGAQPPTASYKISDSDTSVQTLNLTLGTEGMTPEFTENGLDASFNPNAQIGNSGVTWADLTFAFLWNPNATTVKKDKHFGEERYIISIPRPGGNELFLWIESDSGRLTEAEERSADGKLQKVIKVVSVKNFDDLWMVKDVDIIQPQTRARASLRIDSVVTDTKK